MPTPDYDTLRYAPTDRYRRVSQVLPLIADRGLDAILATFGRLKKWSVPLWAQRWGVSEDTAARDCRGLYDLGLVACLAGVARTTTGAHHGGRTPDVWFLTPLGAHALAALVPAWGALRAPQIVRGRPVRTAAGLWKYPRASLNARAQNDHDLDCVRVALHLGMYDKGTPWQIRPTIAFPAAAGGTDRRLIPDFRLEYRHTVWEPRRGPTGRAVQRTAALLELEGTEEMAHIAGKHANYYRYGEATHGPNEETTLNPLLVVILSFASARTRQTVIRRHIAAYGRNYEQRYRLAFIDLATLLASPPGALPWAQLTVVDHTAEAARQRRNRLLGR